MPKIGDNFVGVSFPEGSEVKITVTNVQDGWLVKRMTADGKMLEVLDISKCPEEIEDVLQKLVAEKDGTRRNILMGALRKYALEDVHQEWSNTEYFSTPTSLNAIGPAFEVGGSKELEYESYQGTHRDTHISYG
ncbi:MAG: hypothetical protein H8D67_32110 [Deltaproteobacteria bacterium]|nr:hypothetical protein [Deltaproteobacteria bacterium]